MHIHIHTYKRICVSTCMTYIYMVTPGWIYRIAFRQHLGEGCWRSKRVREGGIDGMRQTLDHSVGLPTLQHTHTRGGWVWLQPKQRKMGKHIDYIYIYIQLRPGGFPPPSANGSSPFGHPPSPLWNGLGLELVCGMVGWFGWCDHHPSSLRNGWGLELRSLALFRLSRLSLEQGPSAQVPKARVFGGGGGGYHGDAECTAHNHKYQHIYKYKYIYIYTHSYIHTYL